MIRRWTTKRTHPDGRPPARKHHARAMFAGLPRDYDRAGAALSFGQDPRWRRAMVAAVAARRGERILDVATGTGLVAAALARRYGARVVGIDQSPEMLATARARRHPGAANATSPARPSSSRSPTPSSTT